MPTLGNLGIINKTNNESTREVAVSMFLLILVWTTFYRKNFRYLNNAWYIYKYSVPYTNPKYFIVSFIEAKTTHERKIPENPFNSNYFHEYLSRFCASHLPHWTYSTLKFHCHTLSFTDLSWHLKLVLCGFTTSFTCFILTNRNVVRLIT